jgi:hypothetical protein
MEILETPSWNAHDRTHINNILRCVPFPEQGRCSEPAHTEWMFEQPHGVVFEVQFFILNVAEFGARSFRLSIYLTRLPCPVEESTDIAGCCRATATAACCERLDIPIYFEVSKRCRHGRLLQSSNCTQVKFARDTLKRKVVPQIWGTQKE